MDAEEGKKGDATQTERGRIGKRREEERREKEGSWRKSRTQNEVGVSEGR